MPHSDRETRLKYQQDRRNRLRNQGLCVICGIVKVEVYAGCLNCREKSNNIVKNVIEKNLENGKCQCGQARIVNKKVCKRCAKHSRNQHRELKLEVIKGYGGKCNCCGIKIWQFLSVDHVEESGADERRRLGRKTVSSTSLYRKIIREGFPPCYQILCYNCNMALGFFGYCPHRPEIRRDITKKFNHPPRKIIGMKKRIPKKRLDKFQKV
jgi:hypothetical protein